MSAWWKVLVLAVVQALTEFLPVSSSGHLVLAKRILGLEAPGVILEVALHAGTLISILVYYRKRIARLLSDLVSGGAGGQREILALAAGSLPALGFYLFFHDRVEAAFDRPALAAALLGVTGIGLLTLRVVRAPDRKISVLRGVWIGVAQALALLPGISRSGLTIAAGRHLGLAPRGAAEFSLLLAVPALLGATLLKACSLAAAELGDLTLGSLAAGTAVSALVGYGAIAILLRTLSTHRFWLFGFYCLAVGTAGLVLMR